MKELRRYGPGRKFFDTLFFPIRALFIPEDNRFGLTSLREERFRQVAVHCRGRVLDVGCGKNNLFVKNYIGMENGVGIDVFPYEGIDLLVEDMCNLPFTDEEFDTVCLIAIGGHIPKSKRVDEFKEFARVLKPGGRLIMTEGEPVTQTLNHIWRHYSMKLVGRQSMDSERGMDEEEEYCMPLSEIMAYLNTPPFELEKRIRFMWKLNNIYVAVKRPV